MVGPLQLLKFDICAWRVANSSKSIIPPEVAEMRWRSLRLRYHNKQGIKLADAGAP